MNANKLSDEIVKSFFQTNNIFQTGSLDSYDYLLDALEDKGFLVDEEPFQKQNDKGVICSAIINDLILIHCVNDFHPRQHSTKRLEREFGWYQVKIILVLKFDKDAQVKRKSREEGRNA